MELHSKISVRKYGLKMNNPKEKTTVFGPESVFMHQKLMEFFFFYLFLFWASAFYQPIVSPILTNWLNQLCFNQNLNPFCIPKNRPGWKATSAEADRDASDAQDLFQEVMKLTDGSGHVQVVKNSLRSVHNTTKNYTGIYHICMLYMLQYIYIQP